MALVYLSDEMFAIFDKKPLRHNNCIW